jgi:hypothetical protein
VVLGLLLAFVTYHRRRIAARTQLSQSTSL